MSKIDTIIFSRLRSHDDDGGLQKRTSDLPSRNSVFGNTKSGSGDNAVRNYKYTLLSFIPIVLFEQFQRLFNCFWLAQCIIVLVPGMTPTNPISTILAFAFVISLSMAKVGYEDYQRYYPDQPRC